MGRAPCCDKTKVKRGPWSPEEDETLKNYVEKYGTGGNWIALPHKAGLKRCGKSCRLRWLNYLRPHIKRGSFTEEEDNIIISLYDKIGSRWSVIASNLPGRTDNDVKNHWNTKLKKKLFGRGDVAGDCSKSPSILSTNQHHHSQHLLLPNTNSIHHHNINISSPSANIADIRAPTSSSPLASTHDSYNLPIVIDPLIYSPSFTTFLSAASQNTLMVPSRGYEHAANLYSAGSCLDNYSNIPNQFHPQPTTNSSSSLEGLGAIFGSTSSITADHCKNSCFSGMEDADVLLADFGFGYDHFYGNGSLGFRSQQKSFDGSFGHPQEDHVAQGLCHTSTFTDCNTS